MSTDEREQLLNQEDQETAERMGLTSGLKLKETMIILAILSTNMLGLCVDMMPVTFFNYEAKMRGLLEYQTGIVMGSYDFGRIIVGPLCPSIIRKITAKKSMILGGSICGLSSVLFGLIAYLRHPKLLVALFAIMRTMSGSGAILLNVSCTAILMQSKSYSNATLFGWIELAIGMGYTVGGLVGAALIKWVGFQGSFIVIGVIVCVSAIPCIICVPNITDVNVGGDKSGWGDFIMLPGVLNHLLVFVMTNYGATGVLNMIGDWIVRTFGVSISTWSLYFSPAFIMYMVGSLAASAITNRGYVYSTIFAAAPVYILCYFLMCPSPLIAPLFKNKSYLPMTVTMNILIQFVVAHILVPNYQAVVNLALVNGHDKETVNTYAIISSATNFAWAIGAMLGPPLTGVTTQLIGFPWASTISGFIAFIVMAALAISLIIMRLLGKRLS